MITFAGLTPEIVGRVVDKFVMQLEVQLADRNVTIELSAAAKEWLAERGYDRLYGARPLARVIQEHIKKPLAEELLFGKLVKGGSVKVTLKDGKLDFEIIEAALPALPKPDEDGDGGVGSRGDRGVRQLYATATRDAGSGLCRCASFESTVDGQISTSCCCAVASSGCLPRGVGTGGPGVTHRRGARPRARRARERRHGEHRTQCADRPADDIPHRLGQQAVHLRRDPAARGRRPAVDRRRRARATFRRYPISATGSRSRT